MRRLSLTIFAVSLAFAGLSAAAEPSTVDVRGSAPTPSGSYQMLQETVNFGDLDLSAGGNGAATLLQRINASAARICGETSVRTPSHDFAEKAAKCHKDAVRKAVAKVGSPALSQAASAAP